MSMFLVLHLTAVLCGAVESDCSGECADKKAVSFLQVSLDMAVGQEANHSAPSPTHAFTHSLTQERDASRTEISEFCVNGFQFPQLYVLGFQKAASSTLADTLLENTNIIPAVQPKRSYADQYDVKCWDKGRGCSWKEFHFWDTWLPEKSLLDYAEKAALDMQEFLPRCNPRQQQGTPVADFSPDSVSLVPLPQGTLPTGEQYGHARFVTNKTDISVNLPVALLASYGNYLARRLTFVVTIREPLARMHSAYYHAYIAESHGVCGDCLLGDSFSSSLLLSMAEAEKSPPIYHDWLYRSLAGYQLQQWTKHMAADQFVVVPFIQMVSNLGSACQEITSRLRIRSHCSALMEKQVNQDPHPKLGDEGLTSEDFRRFKAIVEPDAQLLSRLLVDMHNQGASLVGYRKRQVSASGSNFRSWLEQNW
eukprot:TRINITY_DN8435_c0_g1_i2.p1 TRINITY_DN8435_c0_g1~~TRINITY_DN8435_c0_g1_i2.p1  ORF type:complete len:422 (+),score=63.05 TRINITY_DN8435_c0_g1_i2:30-1295(+)